jgi:hypothetical protein
MSIFTVNESIRLRWFLAERTTPHAVTDSTEFSAQYAVFLAIEIDMRSAGNTRGYTRLRVLSERALSKGQIP